MVREYIDGVEIEDPLTLGMEDISIYFSNRLVKPVVVDDVSRNCVDLLTYNSYESYDAWRILCLLNRITDPIDEIYPGRVFYIPRYGDLAEYLASKLGESLVRIVDLDDLGREV